MEDARGITRYGERTLRKEFAEHRVKMDMGDFNLTD